MLKTKRIPEADFPISDSNPHVKRLKSDLFHSAEKQVYIDFFYDPIDNQLEEQSDTLNADDSAESEKDTPKYVCNFPGCGKSFKKSSKLSRHLTSHSDERPFKCSTCSKSYKRKDHLQLHQQSHSLTTPKPYTCDQCTASYSTSSHLKRHMKTHEIIKPYKCEFEGCDMSFSKSSQHRKHVADHLGEGVFKCDVEGCGKSFKTNQRLKNHGKVHSEDPRYACGHGYCQQTFPKWSLLQAHIKSEHKLKCDVCEKEFSKRYNLKVHMKIHLEDPVEIKCTEGGCGRGYQSEKALKAHIKTSHQNVKPYECEECSSSFAHKHVLARHKRVHEPEHLNKPRKKRKDALPQPTILEHITGYNYDHPDTGRVLPCTVDGCIHKFRRQYDLDRHKRSVHLEIIDENQN